MRDKTLGDVKLFLEDMSGQCAQPWGVLCKHAEDHTKSDWCDACRAEWLRDEIERDEECYRKEVR